MPPESDLDLVTVVELPLVVLGVAVLVKHVRIPHTVALLEPGWRWEWRCSCPGSSSRPRSC